MYKISFLLLLTLFCSACAKEIISDDEIYIGTWEGDTSPYFPHYIIEIKEKGRGTYCIEESKSTSTSTNGRVFITESTVDIGSDRFRINAAPKVDSLGNVWMSLDDV